VPLGRCRIVVGAVHENAGSRPRLPSEISRPVRRFTQAGRHHSRRTTNVGVPDSTRRQPKKANDWLRSICVGRHTERSCLLASDEWSSGSPGVWTREMWDRYDVRDSHRDREDGWDRNFGSRGSTTERAHDLHTGSRDVFTNDLDLPRSRARPSLSMPRRVYAGRGGAAPWMPSCLASSAGL
jgi:hypothetical protein